MEHAAHPTTDDPVHQAHVDRSIKELQRKISDSEDILAELRRTAGPMPASPAASLAIVQAGYEHAARAEPFLPFIDSVLPALLALRKTHQVVTESQAGTAAQEQSLDAIRRRLAVDKARLDDHRALQSALEARLAALRSGRDARRDTTPAQRRREKLEALRAQQDHYDSDTSALLRALKTFIHDRLGAMLAAEELGGPVVGDMIDVQTEELAAGFSAQGKPRKTSAQPNAKKDAKRQRRIDEIWGRGDRDQENENENGNENEDEDEEEANERDESTAAGAEMQELTEQLLNALAEADGDSSAAYVTLARESAAARFLVRSKVAQFHPRDATKLRLIDFGRELED